MPRLLSIAALGLMLSTCVGCGSFFGRLRGETPTWALKKMEDPHFPDERREGINYLADQDFGKRPPWTTRYKQIAQDDFDYTVRASAVRALNRARDRSATDVFIKALSDRNDLVRLEAAKALANVPDPKAIDPLTKIVTSPVEGRDLRIAAADALRHYRDIGVARSLVNVLNGKDFGVAWQARHSLRTLTGKDLKYDERAWLVYLTQQNPFS
jgi:hypothetical protein